MYISDFIKVVSAPKFIGQVASITKVGATSTIHVIGSFTTELFSGVKVRIQGAPPNINLIYTVQSATINGEYTDVVTVEEIASAVDSTGSTPMYLYKGVNLTTTEVQLTCDNTSVSFDGVDEPINTNTTINNAIIKLNYDESNNQVKFKTYGWLLRPKEEQAQTTVSGILGGIGYSNLNEYFKGMYEFNDTLFSSLSDTEIDTHMEIFYQNMQNATITDAGSFAVINDSGTALMKPIYYFIDNYDVEYVNKIKYLGRGESVLVEDGSGVEVIVTCARPCAFSFAG